MMLLSTIPEASGLPVIQERRVEEALSFGRRVREARERLGFSLTEAARRSKIAPQKFQDAENGADSRATTVAAIALGLRVSADTLLGIAPQVSRLDKSWSDAGELQTTPQPRHAESAVPRDAEDDPGDDRLESVEGQVRLLQAELEEFRAEMRARLVLLNQQAAADLAAQIPTPEVKPQKRVAH